ncbi:hypothetical protein [Anaerotignum sp.]
MFASIILSMLLIVAEPADIQYDYIGTYTVSAYNFYEGDGENFSTASGSEPKPYVTVAMHGYPYGTELYIDGIGEVIVEDTGGFPDDWIDLHIGYDPIDSFDMQERDVYLIRRGNEQ